MITVNNKQYESIELAAQVEGLPLHKLNPELYSIGYGVVNDKEIIFPHLIPKCHYNNTCNWINNNYNSLMELLKKQGIFDEDDFHNVFEYIIRKGTLGQIRSYKAAFLNRYKGRIKDRYRASKIVKATVTESDIETTFNWDDPEEELSIFDLYERSVTDTTPDKSCNEAVNNEIKIQVTQEVLRRYFPHKQVDFFIDYEMNGRHDKKLRTEDFATKHGLGKRRARAIITMFRKKVYDPEIQQEILSLYEESRYPESIDELTLNHIINH